LDMLTTTKILTLLILFGAGDDSKSRVAAPVVSAPPAASSTFAEAPPAAPGFKSTAEVKLAILARAVKVIEQPKEVPAGVLEKTDLVYGKVGDRELKCDLYRLADRKKPAPCLVFVHGGGWSGGSRDIYKYYTVRYAQKGYVAATISYRFSGEAPFPAAVEDCACAVRWLRANASAHGIDPGKIALIGGSAGGHLAMMVGYSGDGRTLERTGGNPDVSSGVEAVVNFYGPCDLTTDFAKKAGVVKRFLGGKSYDEAPELYRKASPIFLIAKDAPPTLILHGTIDEVVPIEQSDVLAARLKELGVPCVYDRLEGWPHTMDLAEVVNTRCRYFLDRFLEKHLPLAE
jgi:acetyl esterase/lipase